MTGSNRSPRPLGGRVPRRPISFYPQPSGACCRCRRLVVPWPRRVCGVDMLVSAAAPSGVFVWAGCPVHAITRKVGSGGRSRAPRFRGGVCMK